MRFRCHVWSATGEVRTWWRLRGLRAGIVHVAVHGAHTEAVCGGLRTGRRSGLYTRGWHSASGGAAGDCPMGVLVGAHSECEGGGCEMWQGQCVGVAMSRTCQVLSAVQARCSVACVGQPHGHCGSCQSARPSARAGLMWCTSSVCRRLSSLVRSLNFPRCRRSGGRNIWGCRCVEGGASASGRKQIVYHQDWCQFDQKNDKLPYCCPRFYHNVVEIRQAPQFVYEFLKVLG